LLLCTAKVPKALGLLQKLDIHSLENSLLEELLKQIASSNLFFVEHASSTQGRYVSSLAHLRFLKMPELKNLTS